MTHTLTHTHTNLFGFVGVYWMRVVVYLEYKKYTLNKNTPNIMDNAPA